MTNQEILEKAIQKAIDGGWDNIGNKRIDERLVIRFGTYNFDIAFFKALWGEQKLTGLDSILASKDMFTGVRRTHYWQYHIQQMVTAEDPIQYLGENI